MGLKVGLAGESAYQSAIKQLRVGDRVSVVHQVGNPHDEDALAVLSTEDQVIGYVPRANWLRQAIHDEGQGCDAHVYALNKAGAHIGVVIELELNSDGVDVIDYELPRERAQMHQQGCTLLLAAMMLLPLIAAAPAAPSLSWYVGKYPHDKVGGVTFVRHPLVKKAVQSASWEPVVTSEVLEEGVAGPITRQGSVVVSTACRAHSCDEVNWTIAISSSGRSAAVCYHNAELMGERSRWFFGGSPIAETAGECPDVIPERLVARLAAQR